jgi:hypothetical protein
MSRKTYPNIFIADNPNGKVDTILPDGTVLGSFDSVKESIQCGQNYKDLHPDQHYRMVRGNHVPSNIPIVEKPVASPAIVQLNEPKSLAPIENKLDLSMIYANIDIDRIQSIPIEDEMRQLIYDIENNKI